MRIVLRETGDVQVWIAAKNLRFRVNNGLFQYRVLGDEVWQNLANFLEYQGDMNALKEAAEQAAQTATTKASEASASETSASTSAQTATTKANEASASAQTATTKASEASASAQTATTKASEASASAQTATQKASEASTSAQTATTKASEASTSAQTATTKASEASASAQTATTKASEASASAQTATTKASEASASAIEANNALFQISSVGYQGTYNPVTNTPVLSAMPNSFLNDGAWYLISNAGNLSFSTSSTSNGQKVNKGDILRKKGSYWDLDTTSDVSTKALYLISQYEAFTPGELQALKVLKRIEIGCKKEDSMFDVWIVNSLSKNRTLENSIYLNFISLKNIKTNQQVNRNFTESEITNGYAELDLSSVTDYEGCVAKIWFDYSLTTLDNTFLVSGTAQSYQIKLLPSFTSQNFSMKEKNIFSTNQLVPRKYVNPTDNLYVFNYGTNFIGSGYIAVTPSSTLIIKGISPAGNAKALQYCDASRNILQSVAGYTLGTSAFVNNQFSVTIPEDCYFIYFTIKIDTESNFDYSKIRVYYSDETNKIEKVLNNPIQATTITDGAKTYSGKLVLDSSLVPIKSTLKYAKSYFKDMTGLTFIGFTPTFADGAIKLSGGVNDFSQYLTINNMTNSDEQVMVELLVRVNNIGTTNYGIGIGKRSINTWSGQARSILGQVSFTDANATISFSELTTLANRGVKTSNLGIRNGDFIRIRFIQSNFNATIQAQNITRGNFWSDKFTAYNLITVNTADLAIWNFGGSNDILSIRVISGTPVNNNIICIGDSKTKGDTATRWSRFIDPLGPVSIMAGNSDRTVEVIKTLPYLRSIKSKYAIICLLRNDIASGVSNFTWQSNYINIVSALTESGTKVIHLLPLPENSLSQANQDMIKSFIVDNFGISNCIDVSQGWDSSMLSSDNIHQNEKGDRYIASVVLASGKIPISETIRIDENWEDYLKIV